MSLIPQPFGPDPFRTPFGVPATAPTARSRPRSQRKAAQTVLDSALKSTRLGRAFTKDGLTDAQRSRLVRRIAANARDAARSATQDLQAGILNTSEWKQVMRDGILSTHEAATLGWLGRRDLTANDRRQLTELAALQLQYLDRFAREIRDGTQELDGTAVARAGLYGSASWAVAQGIGKEQAKRKGFDQGRSRLGISDHCEECLSEVARGWVAIDTIVPIGARICKANCRCHLEYRKSAKVKAQQQAEPVEVPTAVPSIGSGTEWPASRLDEAEQRGQAYNVRWVRGLTATEVTPEQFEEVNGYLSRLPSEVHEVIRRSGKTLELFAGQGMTDHPDQANLRGVTPRGWEGTGLTWDNVPGAGGKKTYITANRLHEGHGSTNLVLHEHAHTYDEALRFSGGLLSDGPEWREVHRVSGTQWGEPYLQDHPDEGLAESFARFFHSEKTRAELPTVVRDFWRRRFNLP